MKLSKKGIAALLLAAGLSASAYAAQANESEKNDSIAATKAAVTIDHALNLSLQKVPGTAISILFDQGDKNGKAIWKVEILASQGELHDLRIDAQTGVVLNNSIDKKDSEDQGDNEGQGENESQGEYN
jgi:uncharacterized membrane protein YkoI